MFGSTCTPVILYNNNKIGVLNILHIKMKCPFLRWIDRPMHRTDCVNGAENILKKTLLNFMVTDAVLKYIY